MTPPLMTPSTARGAVILYYIAMRLEDGLSEADAVLNARRTFETTEDAIRQLCKRAENL